MSKLITAARPYAKAVFEFSLENNQLNAWRNLLQNASLVVKNTDFKNLLVNPTVSAAQILDLLFSVLEKQLDQNSKNFLSLLAVYRHLIILPAISELYNAFCADYEKIIDAYITSAFELTDQQKLDISEALKKRLNRNIELHCAIDKNILGGAIIRVGDLVIDGSGHNKLKRLTEYMRGNVVCN